MGEEVLWSRGRWGFPGMGGTSIRGMENYCQKIQVGFLSFMGCVCVCVCVCRINSMSQKIVNIGFVSGLLEP